jgi:hypothetical protein
MIETFVLVISMWGNNGSEWLYIGNQMSLQQEMTEEQCLYLIDEEMWETTYDNEHYRMLAQCYPVKCAEEEAC